MRNDVPFVTSTDVSATAKSLKVFFLSNMRRRSFAFVLNGIVDEIGTEWKSAESSEIRAVKAI